jgi:hypothetical protein
MLTLLTLNLMNSELPERLKDYHQNFDSRLAEDYLKIVDLLNFD